MKIKLLSDLHLEGRHGYHVSKKPQPWADYAGEDVLVLAGDIAVGAEAVIQAIDFFLAKGFPEIVYVAGNHECYHHSRDELNKLKRVLEPMRKVHYLDCNEIVKIQDVSFFGGTLWTNFGNDSWAKSTASRGINDFRIIDGWTVTKAAEEYERQINYIKWAYENTPGKKVIVTHFLPAQECVSERFKGGHVEMLLNKYFANDLGDWISDLSGVTWLFGHTHDALDFNIGDTRLVSNPLGYARELVPDSAKFNPSKVIEV